MELRLRYSTLSKKRSPSDHHTVRQQEARHTKQRKDNTMKRFLAAAGVTLVMVSRTKQQHTPPAD